MIVLSLNVALEVPEPQDESIVNIRDAPISLFYTSRKVRVLAVQYSPIQIVST